MESEREQVEALRKWWQENGKTTIIGIVVGLSAVFGWTSWQSYQRTQSELASQRYQALVEAAGRDSYQEVEQQTTNLVEDFPDSGYASLASLIAAQSALADQDPEGAKSRLNWVLEKAMNDQIKDIAHLRLARLAMSESQFTGALDHLKAIKDTNFAGLIAEIRGDARVAQGQHQAAREAYQAVIADTGISSDTRSRVQVKLDDLGTLNVASDDA